MSANAEQAELVATSAADRAWFATKVTATKAAAAQAGPLTIDALRAFTLGFASTPDAQQVPSDLTTRKEAIGDLPGCWFVPAGIVIDAAPVLYFHGGGYVVGSIEASRGLAAAIAQGLRAPLLAVGYRQAPEAPFPAAVHDACASLAWLAARSSSSITLIGDSAGAALAVTAALKAGGLRSRVLGVIASSGVFDLAPEGGSWVSNSNRDFASRPMAEFLYATYLGEADPKSALADILGADLSGLPPLLLQAGTFEVMLDDSLRLAEKARSAGVSTTLETYDAMPHNFIKYARPVSDLAIGRARVWRDRLLPQSAPGL